MRFEALAETLLKGGIAPRHVRRYVGELSDHLDDLVRRQQEAGYHGDEAVLRARALLGDDRELAAAMLAEPTLKSWPARLPWLFFGLFPPLAVIALFFLTILPVVGLAVLLRDALPHGAAMPDWFRALAYGVTGIANLLFAPGLAVLMITAARHRRLAMGWPVLGTLLIAATGAQFQVGFGTPGNGHIGLGALLWLWHAPATMWNGPLALAQLLLTLAPLALLWRGGMTRWTQG
ncbi:MAG TPA: hypothetical protein VFS01_14590 [Rhizomicrobium sp.]|nr:hypothetical protein [Rhizomicrobium sp.]